MASIQTTSKESLNLTHPIQYSSDYFNHTTDGQFTNFDDPATIVIEKNCQKSHRYKSSVLRRNKKSNHHHHHHHHHYECNFNTSNQCNNKNYKLTYNNNNIIDNNDNNRSNLSIWKRETKIFCQTTSIRGIPHIMRARNPTIRRMWITFVLALIIGWGVSMIFLLRQYLEFNVIHPPQVLRDVNSPFPSVTICNLRPISPDGERIMEKKGLKTPRQYARDTNSFGQRFFMSSRNYSEYRTLTGAMNFAAYLESIPSNVSQQLLGYEQDKLVINCQMLYLKGSKRLAIPCGQSKHKQGGKWRHFVHAQYLNCYTLDSDPELENNITTLEMFLYLSDNMNTSTCIDCFHNEIKSQLSGAVFTVHTPGTYPNINSKGINVSPGSLTEITLKNVLNIQKSPPYGRCSQNTPSNLQMYGYKIAYSEFACRQLKIQADINKECNCKAIEYPIHKDDIPYCSSLTGFTMKSQCDNPLSKNSKHVKYCYKQLLNVIKNVRCKARIIKKYNKDVVEECKMPCSFHSYETDRSISNWPTKLFQVQWLNSRLAKSLGLIDRDEFRPYRQALQLQTNNKHREAMKILYSTNVLERNLLALLINRPNFNLHKVEEKEVLSLTSFLSQSGGLFSIWLGLTMISIVEVIELFVHCCTYRPNNKDNNNNNNNKQKDDGTITSLPLTMDSTSNRKPDDYDMYKETRRNYRC